MSNHITSSTNILFEDYMQIEYKQVVYDSWILTSSGKYRCSVCSNTYNISDDLNNNFNFCPGCGADMKGKRDESK